jgi:hypothetical protein
MCNGEWLVVSSERYKKFKKVARECVDGHQGVASFYDDPQP